MEWYAQQSQDWFGIWKDEGETFVGGVGLSGIEEGKEIAEIGMWLLPEFWGKGIFAEDLDFIVDHAKNKWNLKGIEGIVEVDNKPCLAAIKKI